MFTTYVLLYALILVAAVPLYVLAFRKADLVDDVSRDPCDSCDSR